MQGTCPECGGALEQQNVTHDVRHQGNLYSFLDVPAKVCASCGAVYLDASVLKQIEEALKRGREPERHIEVPVFSFQRLSA